MIVKESEINLREYLEIIKRRIGLIILLIAISVSASGIISFYILEPVFEASTTLMVSKPNEEEASLQYSDVLLSQMLVKTYGEIIKSRSILKQVIEKLKLEITPEQLKDKIVVSPVKDTEIVEIKVSDTSPKLAKDIANKLSEIFINEVRRIMKINNVQVIDRAELPLEAVEPRPKINIIIAAFLGIIVGLGIAFLLEYLDSTIKTSEDIEKHLNLMVIGNIPDIDSKIVTGRLKGMKAKTKKKLQV